VIGAGGAKGQIFPDDRLHYQRLSCVQQRDRGVNFVKVVAGGDELGDRVIRRIGDGVFGFLTNVWWAI
jgi:hypothetical protein